MPDIRLDKKVKSPHLPPARNSIQEKFTQVRYRAAYCIWKRIIQKYFLKRASLEEGFNLLDVGCGTGNFLCCLENWFPNANITGIDMSNDLLEFASDRTKKTNLLLGSAEYIPLDNESIHVISALQVIEHFSNPEVFLKEAYRLLKTQGLLLIATPNPNGLAAKLLGQKWQGIRYDHVSLKVPRKWHEAIEKGGFSILNEGTTLFNGIPVIGRFPFGFPFQIIQAIWGWFPWQLGESYMFVARKQ